MSRLPDGTIFEFDVERNGLNIDVVRRDLVYCENCKYAQPCLNWKGEVVPDKITCNRHLKNLFNLKDFCSYGERKDDEILKFS